MPSTTATSPEGRLEELERYSRRLAKEREAFAQTATRAEFLAYLGGDYDDRDDRAGELIGVEQKALVAGLRPFTQTPPVTVPQTRTTRLGRMKQAHEHLERLRLWHNTQGARLRSGEITQAQWDDWKTKIWQPRFTEAHRVIRELREAIWAEV